MSFSSDAKLELVQVMPSGRCCALAELGAILRAEGAGHGGGEGFAVTVGSPAVARRVHRLFRAAGFPGRAEIARRARHGARRTYTVRTEGDGPAVLSRIEEAIGGPLECASVPGRECCRAAYLRGAFLSRGSLAAPSRGYHFEVSLEGDAAAESIEEALRSFGLPARSAERKGARVVYLKESEAIAQALNLMGAHGALLQLENVRIAKEMRNRVNRLVNCETANVDKTVTAAGAQLEAILVLERTVGLEALPAHLRELARLRLEHPYASLRELGELLAPRVTKSGVSYRMRQIERLAAKVRAGAGPREEEIGPVRGILRTERDAIEHPRDETHPERRPPGGV